MQEYLTGKEIVINCTSRNSKHALGEIFSYNKKTSDIGAPLYDITYLVHDIDEEIQSAIDYNFKVLDALVIKYGSSHTEIMLTNDGPVLIECGSRLMGRTPSFKSLHNALGFSPIERMIDSYISDYNHEKNIKKIYRPKKYFMHKFIVSYNHAKLLELPAIKDLSMLSTVKEIDFDITGHTMEVEKTVDMITISGECLLQDEDKNKVINDYKTISYIEENASELLFKTKENSGLSKENKIIMDKIKNKQTLEKEYNNKFHGYNNDYVNIDNFDLFVFICYLLLVN